MALKVPYEISCQCGAVFLAELYEYVFKEHDPELRDSILAGEFNQTTCPSCGKTLETDISFLYRDEENKLWIWVRGEEEQKQELVLEDQKIEGHYLDDQQDYRKFVVQGRAGLLEVLLREDLYLRKSEGIALKEKPAIRVMLEGGSVPGYLLLNGDRIKYLPIPLMPSPPAWQDVDSSWPPEPWLDGVAEGANLHNRYSSFLDEDLGAEWRNLLAEVFKNEDSPHYEVFCRAWAEFRTSPEDFQIRLPKVFNFFQKLSVMEISRPIVAWRGEEISGQA